MTTESAVAAPEAKRYKYYGREYKMSVKDIAAMARVSLRLAKDVLKLHSLGYRDAIEQGYTVAECFAHAGIKHGKRKSAPRRESIDEFKTVIIYLRVKMWPMLLMRLSDCARCCSTLALTPMGEHRRRQLVAYR